ncbi:hypothetical protein SADUNF_Sadunf09G0033700 [Salix dunnii]|uniref:Uncharacterized protein n=1 Tax=Salix dunnii TaxID=1413687 RepID=A0A835JUU1_9ROSI|nr:hypothetical protein SADUNF_Sadunf09G0033700 [Salix dunnii]
MSTRINQVKYKPTGINRTQYPSTRDRVSGNRWPGRTCGFRFLKRSIVSPVNFLKHFGRKVAKAPCLGRRSSHEVSSSGRSRPSVAPGDTHVAEAIKDCIEFINSSSLPRLSYHGSEVRKFHKVFAYPFILQPNPVMQFDCHFQSPFVADFCFVFGPQQNMCSMIGLFGTNHFVPGNRNGSDENVLKGLDVKMQNAPPNSVSSSTTTDSSLT